MILVDKRYSSFLIRYLRNLLRVIIILTCLSWISPQVCFGQFQWNWRDPLDLNHFDWGDNKLLLYNSIGLGVTLKFTKRTPLDNKLHKPTQLTGFVDVLREYSRPPFSDVLIGRLRWVKPIRPFLRLGGDLSLYKVDDQEVNTEGIGAQIVFNWILINREKFKIVFDNGVGPNVFRQAFPLGGTQFNFSTFYGLVFQFNVPTIGWVSIGAKNLHISNAGIAGVDRNPALDAWGLTIGYQFR